MVTPLHMETLSISVKLWNTILVYTFITRCKECGVSPEVVIIWSGHSEDKDVLSSRVNRGYTDFSNEFQLREAEKVNY